MNAFQSFSLSPRRRGNLERIMGQCRFGVELARPGDLHLLALRPDQAPARIARLDVSQALALPGVVAVLTSTDIPGINCVGIIPTRKDQPVLAEDHVRSPGNAVALVVAESPQAARAGARAIRLELEPLPALRDPLRAMDSDAPKLGEQGTFSGKPGFIWTLPKRSSPRRRWPQTTPTPPPWRPTCP